MITSASTLTDVLAEYNNSLLWEGNLTLARQRLAAVRWLIANRPKDTDVKGQAFSFDVMYLIEEEKKLSSYIANASGGSRAMFTRARL